MRSKQLAQKQANSRTDNTSSEETDFALVKHPIPTTEERKAITKLDVNTSNPGELGHLNEYSNLEVLNISCLEDLKEIPDSVGELSHLKEFRIDNGNGCVMNAKLPKSLGNLKNLQVLILQGAMVADMPEPTKTPKQVQKIPDSLAQLKNVTEVDLSMDGLNEVPVFVAGLTNLKSLDLTFNGLRDLPDFLNDLPELKTVKMGENCEITQNKHKQKELQKRFPRIQFDFDDEYTDCEDLKEAKAARENKK
jgi:Leucine-rich repeat (LRR) protein